MSISRQDYTCLVSVDGDDLERLGEIAGLSKGIPGTLALKWLAADEIAAAIRRRAPEGCLPVLTRHSFVRLQPLDRGTTYRLNASLVDMEHRIGVGLRIDFSVYAPKGVVLRGEVDMAFMSRAAHG